MKFDIRGIRAACIYSFEGGTKADDAFYDFYLNSELRCNLSEESIRRVVSFLQQLNFFGKYSSIVSSNGEGEPLSEAVVKSFWLGPAFPEFNARNLHLTHNFSVMAGIRELISRGASFQKFGLVTDSVAAAIVNKVEVTRTIVCVHTVYHMGDKGKHLHFGKREQWVDGLFSPPDLREGDWVSLCRGKIREKISQEQADSLSEENRRLILCEKGELSV